VNVQLTALVIEMTISATIILLGLSRRVIKPDPLAEPA